MQYTKFRADDGAMKRHSSSRFEIGLLTQQVNLDVLVAVKRDLITRTETVKSATSS